MIVLPGTDSHSSGKPPARQRFVELGLWLSALVALAINGFLLYRVLADPASGLAGCGEAGGCMNVLSSRWSRVWGISVTLPGTLVCGLVLVSYWMRWSSALALSLALLAGAALWFMGLQVFLLGSFCPLCCAAHAAAGCAIILGMVFLRSGGNSWKSLRPAMLSGGAATLALAAAQWFGPAPVSHRIESVAAHAAAGGIHAQGSGRKVAFAGGNKVFDVSVLPRIGREDAPRVMVAYFDYSCASCRVMHGFLQSMSDRHPGEICLLCLPVPFEHACNSRLTAEDPVHPGACHLARIALAVWRAEPAKFQALHDSFFAATPADEAEAMARACQFVVRERLLECLADPWIDQVLEADAEDWSVLSATSRKMPKLWVKDSRILHGLPSGSEDFIRVLEDELGLTGKGK